MHNPGILWCQTAIPESYAIYELTTNNQWRHLSLLITVTAVNNRLAFRVDWHGTANLDMATIRIR